MAQHRRTREATVNTIVNASHRIVLELRGKGARRGIESARARPWQILRVGRRRRRCIALKAVVGAQQRVCLRPDDLVHAVCELVVLELCRQVRVLLRGRRHTTAVAARRRFQVVRLALDEIGE